MAKRVARSVVLAGIVAGIVSTFVQVVLWLLFTDAFPAILYRDARLAAAIVLGPLALAPANQFDLSIILVATVVHLALSVAFAAPLAMIAPRTSPWRAVLVGGVFGIALYVFALHVMTLVYPWFVVARGGITLVAHVAFGISAAVVIRAASYGHSSHGNR